MDENSVCDSTTQEVSVENENSEDKSFLMSSPDDNGSSQNCIETHEVNLPSNYDLLRSYIHNEEPPRIEEFTVNMNNICEQPSSSSGSHVSPSRNSTNHFMCHDCSSRFSVYDHYKTHHCYSLMQSAKVPVSNTAIEEQFSSLSVKDKLFVESSKSHPNDAVTSVSFLCGRCPAEFVDRISCETHCAVHDVRSSFSCNLCYRSFHLKSQLILHNCLAKRYTTQNHPRYFLYKQRFMNRMFQFSDHFLCYPFECSTCRRTFSTKLRLKIHRRMHHSILTSRCNLCQKLLVPKDDLDSQYFGTREQDVCDDCQKALDFKVSIK